MSKFNVAVVGATGAVGREMVKILEEHKFPVKNLVLLASVKSAGETICFKKKKLNVQELNINSFNNIDIALFSAGSLVSKKYVPIAATTNKINPYKVSP